MSHTQVFRTACVRQRLAALVVATALWVMSGSTVQAQGARGQQPRGLPRREAREGLPLDGQRVQRLQDALARIARQRLNLTDEQFRQLQEVATRREAERRTIRRDEQAARQEIRQELLVSERANEARLSELLEQLPKLEKRRIELQEQEQRELARFLSASQRARYLGLQEELRRSMQDLQRVRPEGDPSGGDDRQQRPPRRPPPA